MPWIACVSRWNSTKNALNVILYTSQSSRARARVQYIIFYDIEILCVFHGSFRSRPQWSIVVSSCSYIFNGKKIVAGFLHIFFSIVFPPLFGYIGFKFFRFCSVRVIIPVYIYIKNKKNTRRWDIPMRSCIFRRRDHKTHMKRIDCM